MYSCPCARPMCGCPKEGGERTPAQARSERMLQVSASITKLNNSTSAEGEHGVREHLRQWYNDKQTPYCLCGGSRPYVVLKGFCCKQKEERMTGAL